MAASKKQNYLHGAAILAEAVIIIKILGALYKIPMGNILDNEGFAHFNVAYNLYTVLLSLSTVGLPIAVAKLISEANNLEKPLLVRRTFKVATTAFVVLGTLGTAIMFIFPIDLAAFIGDVEASQSIVAMAPAVLLVCITAAFRGYTEGHSDMRPTATSQIIETSVKVVFGIGLALILESRGLSMPLMSAGAISGVTVGALAACIYISIIGIKRLRNERLQMSDAAALEKKTTASEGAILKRLIKICVPIAFGSCVLSIITLVNTKLILGQLQISLGSDSEQTALNLFGIYSKALTIYNLPAAIITPLTISIIPAISGLLAKKQFGEAKNIVESSLRIGTIIALPMAVGISVLASPIIDVLYFGSGNQGAALLAIMGVASFFVCLALMTTAILQAGGRERLPMYTMLIGGAISITLNWFLVGNPSINIYGAPIGTLACYVVMSGLNLWFVMHKMPERPKLSKIFVKSIISCAVMGISAWLVYPAILGLLGAGPEPERKIILFALVPTVAVAVVVYGVMTIFTKAITLEDMKLVPKGEKIAKLLRIK